jgi:hypothetical protein
MPADASRAIPTARDAGADYLDRCAAALDRLQEPPTAELRALEAGAAARWSAEEARRLNREVARTLHARHARALALLDVPADVRSGFEAEFARIAGDLERKPDAHWTFASYHVKATLRILALRRIPAGMYDLEVSGIPRSLVLRQRPRHALRLLAVVVRAGGFSPFFTQHLVDHRLRQFSPAERDAFLGRVGALLRRRPEIRGLLSTSWYNDPALARIRPQLAYLREGFERLGGALFRIGTTPDVVQDAMAFSFERRRLVESGRYVPTAYLGVALRPALLPLAAEGS